jgi:3-hydroxybutyryl-CoA dehydratase
VSTASDDPAGRFVEDLVVGQSASYGKTVTEADIVLFAGISGDTNPVHLDAVFASKTPFKTRIAHGMLSASFISAVLGTKLPGPGAVYVSQSLNFKAPVKIGDTVTARATVAKIDRRRVTLTTTCHIGDTLVLEGEAVIMMPSRAA